MKKVLKVLIFFVCFLAFKTNTLASCSYTRLAELKRMASNVNITYTYTISSKKALFDIRVANLNNDIYLYDSYNNKKYEVVEFLLKNYQDGTKYRFFIKSNDRNCKDEILLTKYVTLPRYNILYGDPICEGISDYTLCQRWGSFNITDYNTYINQIKKYKASLVKPNEIIKVDNKESLLDKILDFLLDYYIYILVLIIIIGISSIIYLTKKNKFEL